MVHFARNEAWNDLTAGAPVRIAGLRGRRWRFRCHVENVATGATWVEVAELDTPRGAGPGRAGEPEIEPPVRRIRSFPEDRIVPLRRRRRGRLDPPPGQGTFDLGLPALGPLQARRSPARARRTVGSDAGQALRLSLWAGENGPNGPAGEAPSGQPTR